MNEGKISKRYAKALLLYAQESNSAELVYTELKKLLRVFSAEPKLELALRNPMVPSKQKVKLLNAAFYNESVAIVSKFFEMVLTNKRAPFIHLMCLSYIELYQKSKSMVPARLVTAVQPTDVMIAKMKSLALGVMPGNLMFESEIDPRIQGGFVLYIDTYRLDASVASQLKQIKQHFIEGNRKIANI